MFHIDERNDEPFLTTINDGDLLRDLEKKREKNLNIHLRNVIFLISKILDYIGIVYIHLFQRR